MIALRKYTPQDHADLNQLHLRTMEHANIPGDPLEDVSEYLENGDLLVAERDGRIVGMGGYFRRDGSCELNLMRVHPDEQGSGIGRLILNELERRIRDAGYAHIVADTARAAGFYLMHGYRITGSHEYRGVVCTELEKLLHD